MKMNRPDEVIPLAHGRTNADRLHYTMMNWGMNRRWVANAMKVEISTVTRWLQPKDSSSHREMSASYLKLFHYCINDLEFWPLYEYPPEELPRNKT